MLENCNSIFRGDLIWPVLFCRLFDEIDPDLKIQMDVLDEHEIKYIELRGVYGKSIVEYSLDEVKELKENIRKRVRYFVIGSPIGKIGIRDDFAPHLNCLSIP